MRIFHFSAGDSPTEGTSNSVAKIKPKTQKRCAPRSGSRLSSASRPQQPPKSPPPTGFTQSPSSQPRPHPPGGVVFCPPTLPAVAPGAPMTRSDAPRRTTPSDLVSRRDAGRRGRRGEKHGTMPRGRAAWRAWPPHEQAHAACPHRGADDVAAPRPRNRLRREGIARAEGARFRASACETQSHEATRKGRGHEEFLAMAEMNRPGGEGERPREPPDGFNAPFVDVSDAMCRKNTSTLTRGRVWENSRRPHGAMGCAEDHGLEAHGPRHAHQGATSMYRRRHAADFPGGKNTARLLSGQTQVGPTKRLLSSVG